MHLASLATITYLYAHMRSWPLNLHCVVAMREPVLSNLVLTLKEVKVSVLSIEDEIKIVEMLNNVFAYMIALWV